MRNEEDELREHHSKAGEAFLLDWNGSELSAADTRGGVGMQGEETNMGILIPSNYGKVGILKSEKNSEIKVEISNYLIVDMEQNMYGNLQWCLKNQIPKYNMSSIPIHF